MFFYYLRLARISILRHWGLSLLMVTAIGLGIGAAMTTVTINYLMSADPIPQKSKQLHVIQLDSWDINKPFKEGKEPPPLLTYTDAKNLFDAKNAYRQTMHASGQAIIEPTDADGIPLDVSVRANTADFFSMFDVPFIYGGAWSQTAESNKERLIVLSKNINEKIFAGKNSVGQAIKINGEMYKVAGVIGHWLPKPRYYDVTENTAFNDPEDIFVPFWLIADKKITRRGNSHFWKPLGEGWTNFLNSETVWIHFWVELKDQYAVQDYHTFLDSYVKEQRRYGRFERPLDNRVNTMAVWFKAREVVKKDNNMLLIMAFLFLAVCLLNTLALLSAKFIGKASEIGLRQALGASKITLFYQYLIESACIGIAGGILGLLLANLGLKGIKLLYGSKMDGLVSLDSQMILFAMLLSLLATVIAGLYPTWRACNIAPADQLKSQ